MIDTTFYELKWYCPACKKYFDETEISSDETCMICGCELDFVGADTEGEEP